MSEAFFNKETGELTTEWSQQVNKLKEALLPYSQPGQDISLRFFSTSEDFRDNTITVEMTITPKPIREDHQLWEEIKKFKFKPNDTQE
jgi:hypothetical protein